MWYLICYFRPINSTWRYSFHFHWVHISSMYHDDYYDDEAKLETNCRKVSLRIFHNHVFFREQINSCQVNQYAIKQFWMWWKRKLLFCIQKPMHFIIELFHFGLTYILCILIWRRYFKPYIDFIYHIHTNLSKSS